MVDVVDQRAVDWSWQGDCHVKLRASAADTNPIHLELDPTPAYAHDLDLVRECARACHLAFPLPQPPRIFVLHGDAKSRFNGQTYQASDWKLEDEHDRPLKTSVIALAAKRVPPMPSMTRYLVAHEYGHAVDYALASKRYTDHEPAAKQRDEYRKLRGLGEQLHYGPGNWHVSVAEVFANDFRVLVMGAELEYWPHPFARSQDLPGVVAWWDAARKLDLQLKAKPR